MSYTFARAGLVDTDRILPLIAAYYAFDGIPFDAGEVRVGLDALARTPSLGGAWLVQAEEDGATLAGYFVLTFGFDLEFGGRQATITELFFLPRHRRRGAGTATLLFVEETLRQLGIGAVELQVSRDNAAALSLYLRAGFEAHERIPMSKRIAPR